MVRFGQLNATFAGTVAWAGPSTLKVGKAATLTLVNPTNEPLTVQKQVEVRKLEESSILLETGSNWNLVSTEFENAVWDVLGPGQSKTYKGSSKVTKVSFGSDIKTEKRPYVTYIGTEQDAGNLVEQSNSQATDPYDIVDGDPSYSTGGADIADLGPYTDFTDPEDTATGSSGSSRSMTIVLLIIAVLLAAGGGYAARGIAMRRVLGLS